MKVLVAPHPEDASKRLLKVARELHRSDAEQKGHYPGDGDIPKFKHLPEWAQCHYVSLAWRALRKYGIEDPE